MLLRDRFGPAISTLMGHFRIVTDTIETNAQISAALMTTFAAARQSRQGPFPAAFVTMPSWFRHKQVNLVCNFAVCVLRIEIRDSRFDSEIDALKNKKIRTLSALPFFPANFGRHP